MCELACDCLKYEERIAALFVLAIKEEARAKNPKFMAFFSNGVRDSRFADPCEAIEPEDAGCSPVVVFDPVENLFKEGGARSFQTSACERASSRVVSSRCIPQKVQ